MDISKLNFTITAEYDCDEGEGCYKSVENASWDKAVDMLGDLDSPTYISGYYHSMTICFNVTDKNGNPVEFPKKLMDDYDWILDEEEFSTWDKDEATSIPGDMIKLMEALKQTDEQYADSKKKEIKEKIARLEDEIKELKEELSKL